MLLYKPKKSQVGKGGNRLLLNITVLGSAGPIRFVVSEGEHVASVIDTALKSYAREGRLPVLGSDVNNFVLYSPNAGTEALSPWDNIGSFGVRNFVLCKKPQSERRVDGGREATAYVRKGSGSWKSWFNRSLSRKIVSH
nr:senescence-associated protein [Ipomoea batatas]